MFSKFGSYITSMGRQIKSAIVGSDKKSTDKEIDQDKHKNLKEIWQQDALEEFCIPHLSNQIFERIRLYKEAEHYSATFAANWIQNAIKTLGKVSNEDDIDNQNKELSDWLKSESLEIHVSQYLDNQYHTKIIRYFDMDNRYVEKNVMEEAAQRIMYVVIERFSRFIDQRLEVNNKYCFDFIGFLLVFLTQNMDYDSLTKILNEGCKWGSINQYLLTVMKFVVKLSHADFLN